MCVISRREQKRFLDRRTKPAAPRVDRGRATRGTTCGAGRGGGWGSDAVRIRLTFEQGTGDRPKNKKQLPHTSTTARPGGQLTRHGGGDKTFQVPNQNAPNLSLPIHHSSSLTSRASRHHMPPAWRRQPTSRGAQSRPRGRRRAECPPATVLPIGEVLRPPRRTGPGQHSSVISIKSHSSR